MRELLAPIVKRFLVSVLSLRFSIRFVTPPLSVRRPASPPIRFPARYPTLGAVALAALLRAGIGSAQPVVDSMVVDIWTTSNGLPVNGVTGVTQTRDGYIWVTTWDGFARFDGVRFTVYNRSNTPGLPDNRTTDLFESPDGILWIHTEHNHLVSFANGVARTLGPADGLAGREVSGLFADRDGSLIAATDAGLYVWTGATFKEVWRRPRTRGVSSDVVATLFRDSRSTLWVGMYEGGFFRVSGGQTTYFGDFEGRPLVTVNGFYELDSGQVLVMAYPWQSNRTDALAQGVFAVEGNRLQRLDLGTPERPNTPVSNARRVWQSGSRVALELGRHRFETNGVTLATGQLEWHWRLLESLPVPPGMSASYLGWDYVIRDDGFALNFPFHPYDVLWDREGSLWIATNGQGLWRYRPVPFRTYGLDAGLPAENVYPVLVDSDGIVWTSTLSQDGVFRVDPRQPSLSSVLIPGEGVLSLYEDRTRGVWIGTNSGVCRVARGATGPEACRWLPLPGTQPERIYAIHQDREGGFWFAGDAKLLRFSGQEWQSFPEAFLESGTVTSGPQIRRVRQTLPTRRRIRAIVEDFRGTVWFGAAVGGVMAFVPDERLGYKKGTFHHITTKDGLPSDVIRDLYIDSRGFLWVVTEDAGLARLDVRDIPDPLQAPIVTVQQRDGLPDNAIHSMREDDHGRFWISSNRGLFSIPVQDLINFADHNADRFGTAVFTERDGLQNKEFNGGYYPPVSKGPDGSLWFPSQVGLVELDPARARSHPPPPTLVESITSQGRVRLANGPVVLPAGDRTFEVSYTAFSFLTPLDIQFQYRLEGYDDAWVDAGTRRTAYYTGVPAGDYVFHIRAAGKEGSWSRDGSSVQLSISPLFYETTWFIGLALLLVFGLAGAGYRWRVGLLHARQYQLETLVASRTLEIVSEKRRTEEALRTVAAQADRLRVLDASKSRFFANMSHEFRTPLTLILGPVKQVLEQPGLPETAKSSLGLVLRNGHRLLHLINQLLDLARLDAGALTLHPGRQDLVAFSQQCVGLFESLARLRKIELQFQADQEVLETWFDEEKLERVLLNLLSNALKFTSEGGSVVVRVEQRGDGSAVLSVADTGIGIPEEHLGHIFDRFYQVDTGPTRQREGSGIGLALAYELVELHGGVLSAESRPGEGSRFEVWLPPVPVDRDGEPELGPPERVRASSGDGLNAYLSLTESPSVVDMVRTTPTSTTSPLVLVVEDNADLRTYIRSHLAPSYAVIEAANGADALESALGQVPDLVLSDVMMPVMDGYTLCRRLREDPRTSHIPVVLLTARDDTPSRIDGLESGADDYLAKPFEPEELRVRVSNLIEQRRLLRARYSQAVLVLGANKVSLPKSEVDFLTLLKEAIHEHLADPDFGVDALSQLSGMSRSQLERKLAALVGESPGALLRRIRLERAAQLLLQEGAQVKTVAGAVGFRSVPHFSEAFRQAFGTVPSNYLEAAEPIPTS